MPDAQPIIRLDAEDTRAAWGGSLLTSAQRARREAERRLGLTLEGAVTVRTFPDQRALERHLNARPTHVMAVALPDRGEIAILRPAWRAADIEEQYCTLVHEMVHLILGRKAVGEPPAWLNEGLAMAAAGQSGLADRWRLTVAGALGTLIPLEQMESDVLLGGERQSLAYAQSLSITRFLLQRSFGGDRDMDAAIRALARQLADPRRGPFLLDRLREPLFRAALEHQWRQQYESTWGWISFLSGTACLWFCITLLFLLAYWRKQRMTRLIRERFDDEIDDDAPPPAMKAPLAEDETDEDRPASPF